MAIFPLTLIEFFQQNDVNQAFISDVVSDLKHKTRNIHELVEMLEPILCAKENDLRFIGTKFFVEVLNSLSPNDLNDQELKVIWTFFINRLNDHHSIIPIVLSGCLTLCKLHLNFESYLAEFCTKMFRCIHCQTQKREDREKIYKMLQIASELNSEEFKKMGADWIYGVINSIEGERDPRNLLLIFNFMPQLIKNYSLFHLTDDAFEVFAVYFPVDFTQSDSSAITRDSLAEHLENCLSASLDFINGCVELILEKISSDLKTAKTDSLKLLINITKKFSSDKIEKHFESLWEAIKIEVISDKNMEWKQLALSGLQSLLSNFSSSNETLKEALKIVLKSVLPSINDINCKSFGPNFDIICTCLKSSEQSALYVIPKVLPLLLNDFNARDTEKIIKILECIESICTITNSYNTFKELESSDTDLLRKEIVDTFMYDNNTIVTRLCLRIIGNIKDIMCKKSRFIIYQRLVDLTSDPKSNELFCDISNAAISFNSRFNNEVSEIIVEKLKEQATLQVSAEPIKVLANLMFEPNLEEYIYNFIISFILNNENNERLRTDTVIYLESVMTEKNRSILNDSKTSLIEELVTFIKNYRHNSYQHLKQYTKLLEIFVKYSNMEMQKTVIIPLLTALNPNVNNDLYILSGLLGYLKPNAGLNEYFTLLTGNLIKISLSSNDEERIMSNQILYVVFNKIPYDDLHQRWIRQTLETLRSEILSNRNEAIATFAWITKSLVKRGFGDFEFVMDPLIALLKDPITSNSAVTAFEILTREVPEQYQPLEKYLYKQKILCYLLKKIDCQVTDLADNQVTTIVLVMNIVPLSALKTNIDKIGKTVIKALSLKDQRCILACLNILNKFIEEQNDYFSTYVSHIVDKLLILTQPAFTMKIRLQALCTLKNVTIYSTYLLLPKKEEVVYGIIPVLDDEKRLVRNAARATRMKWCSIGIEEN
ncbi:MMS19 nucleotide excision repair protein [Culicoides brevitarsis]|uniref:MMS19 nucleotide excision repair protein n=1 Tax=Culicoides brevitarsis TaxID=469753 RepID=UPI00307BAA93